MPKIFNSISIFFITLASFCPMYVVYLVIHSLNNHTLDTYETVNNIVNFMWVSLVLMLISILFMGLGEYAEFRKNKVSN